MTSRGAERRRAAFASSASLCIAFASACAFGCSRDDNFLGFDQQAATTSAPPTPPTFPDAAPPVFEDAGNGLGVDAGGGGGAPLPSMSVDASVPPSDAGMSAPDASVPLDASPPLMPPSGVILPNQFADVLGVTPEAVAQRIDRTFQQLFHGDPATQAVYVEVGEDQAYVFDVFHEDTRIDALGYGLLISVELDKKIEFDRLWTFTKTYLQVASGAAQGYFYRTCDVSGAPCSEELGVFGSFYVITALLLAENRWGNGSGIMNYGAEAVLALDAMRNKEPNGVVTDGVINIFDAEAALPVRQPRSEFAGQVELGSVMPAFFEFWGAETGDAFWITAAETGRALLHTAPHEVTGLAPDTTDFEGNVIEDDFKEASYGVGFNAALDVAWHGEDEDSVTLANRLIRFFASFGGSYPALYLYTGEPQNQNPSFALVALNGAAAGLSTLPAREDFIRAVWEMPTQQGVFRFYDGMNQLLALMYLGGYLGP